MPEKRKHEEKEQSSFKLVDSVKQSWAQDLINEGFIDIAEMRGVADIEFALGTYADENIRRKNVHVVAGTEFFSYSGIITPLTERLITIKSLAEKKNQTQTMLGVTSTVAGHFAYYEFWINPLTKKMDIHVIDSRGSEEVAPLHRAGNERVLKHLKLAAEKLSDYSLQTNVAVGYIGDQGREPNLPYHAIRLVMRRCHQLNSDFFDAENEMAVASNQTDIKLFKLAIIKEGAKELATANPRWKSALLLQKITMDELGIIYLDPHNEKYRKHRLNRLSELASSEMKRNEAGERQLFDPVNLTLPGVENAIATLLAVAAEQKKIHTALTQPPAGVTLQHDYASEARKLTSETAQIYAYFHKLNEHFANDSLHLSAQQQDEFFEAKWAAIKEIEENFNTLGTHSMNTAQTNKILVPPVATETQKLSEAVKTYQTYKMHTLFGTQVSVKDNESLQAEAKINLQSGVLKNQVHLDEEYATFLQKQELIEYYQEEGSKARGLMKR